MFGSSSVFSKIHISNVSVTVANTNFNHLFSCRFYLFFKCKIIQIDSNSRQSDFHVTFNDFKYFHCYYCAAPILMDHDSSFKFEPLLRMNKLISSRAIEFIHLKNCNSILVSSTADVVGSFCCLFPIV